MGTYYLYLVQAQRLGPGLSSLWNLLAQSMASHQRSNHQWMLFTDNVAKIFMCLMRFSCEQNFDDSDDHEVLLSKQCLVVVAGIA